MNRQRRRRRENRPKEEVPDLQVGGSTKRHIIDVKGVRVFSS